MFAFGISSKVSKQYQPATADKAPIDDVDVAKERNEGRKKGKCGDAGRK